MVCLGSILEFITFHYRSFYGFIFFDFFLKILLLQPHFLTPRVNSTVFEFCGILSSIYTWKKKFADKQVLVYSDNLCVCVVINDGLKPSSRYRRKTCKQLLKMFKVSMNPQQTKT